MNNNHLHIVTHDIPFPADYGGVVDLFCKLKALHGLGVRIHLHCFTQGRAPQDALNKYCESVDYYPRKKKIGRFSFRVPFIVNSRKNSKLTAALKKDNYPILLEGIHTTWPLYAGELAGRKVAVRLHNAEFEYYKQLAKRERNIIKKAYFLHESRLLKKYEKAISGKAPFLAVSTQDVELYRNEFKAPDIHYIPVFLPYTLAAGKEGKGCFCLYHGNLSVNENEKAAAWLLKKVFSDIDIPFVIAGKDPSSRLKHLAEAHTNTCLVANPSEKEMQDLVAKAHIHILPAFNNTGVKLKLLNALFNGRHCLVNDLAVKGTPLAPYCYQAANAMEFRKKISELNMLPFADEEIQRRQGLLQTEYNNEVNAKKLSAFLWDQPANT